MDPAKGRREGSVFSRFFSCLVRVCVMLRKAGRRRLPEDGIKVSPPSPHSGGASSIVGGCVEVCLRICLWWIFSDLFVVCLCLCVFRLDPSDLHYSSSTAVAVLVRLFYRALARRLPDCLLQQIAEIKITSRSVDHLATTKSTEASQRRAAIIAPPSSEPGKPCCSRQLGSCRSKTP